MPDRAAIITGASRGIGYALAEVLGEEGFALTVTARKPEGIERAANQLRDKGYEVEDLAANMADEDSIRQVVERHRDRYGRLDVLVNNAGVGIGAPATEHQTKYVDMQVDVNLRAIIIFYRECLEMLWAAGAEHSSALVVNMASMAGKSPQPWLSVYAATKAAVIAYTRAMNKEVPPRASSRLRSARGSSTPTCPTSSSRRPGRGDAAPIATSARGCGSSCASLPRASSPRSCSSAPGSPSRPAVSDPLSFDPIEEAGRQWRRHWGAAPVAPMMAVTSVMRVQQIWLARLNETLEPFEPHVRALRGADAAVLQPQRGAPAGEDGSPAAGPPDERDQPDRRARAARLCAAHAASERPPDDAGHDHRARVASVADEATEALHAIRFGTAAALTCASSRASPRCSARVRLEAGDFTAK